MRPHCKRQQTRTSNFNSELTALPHYQPAPPSGCSASCRLYYCAALTAAFVTAAVAADLACDVAAAVAAVVAACVAVAATGATWAAAPGAAASAAAGAACAVCAFGICGPHLVWKSALALFSSACLASDVRFTCTLAVLPAAAFSSRSTAPSLRSVSIWLASVTQAGSTFGAAATLSGATDAVDKAVLPSLAQPAASAAAAKSADVVANFVIVRGVMCTSPEAVTAFSMNAAHFPMKCLSMPPRGQQEPSP